MFTCRGELSVCVSPLPPYQALLPVFRWPVSRAMSVRNRSIVLRYREAPPLGLPWTGLHAGALWVSPPGSGMLDNPNGPAHPSSGRPPLIFKGRTLVPGFTGNRGRGSAACQAPRGRSHQEGVGLPLLKMTPSRNSSRWLSIHEVAGQTSPRGVRCLCVLLKTVSFLKDRYLSKNALGTLIRE